jgi:hypothetical protein
MDITPPVLFSVENIDESPAFITNSPPDPSLLQPATSDTSPAVDVSLPPLANIIDPVADSIDEPLLTMTEPVELEADVAISVSIATADDPIILTVP